MVLISLVSMKIHAKLGGVTHTVPMPSLLTKDTMMIGADVSRFTLSATFALLISSQVTHPPPKGFGMIPPSIAVSVATINGEQTRVMPAIRLQEGRK